MTSVVRKTELSSSLTIKFFYFKDANASGQKQNGLAIHANTCVEEQGENGLYDVHLISINFVHKQDVQVQHVMGHIATDLLALVPYLTTESCTD